MAGFTLFANVTPTHSATSTFTSDDLRRKGAPFHHCGRASLLVYLPGNEIPLLVEMVVGFGRKSDRENEIPFDLVW